MMMLALIAAWWALDARPVARRFALFLTGTAIGLTSLALLVYIGLATVFMLAWKRGSGLDRAVALGAGLALSVGLMWAGFRASGTWESFVWSTQVQSGKGLLACLASHTPYDHRNRLPKDLSLVPIVIAAVWMRLSDAGRRHEQRYELDSALGFAAFVGAGMILVGKLPTYYSWMVYVPLVIGLATTWPEAFGRGARDILAASLVVVAVLVGLPLQAGLTLLDLGNRDPRAAEAFAIRTCEPGDRAFTDYPAYFVVRSRVQEVYTPGALGWKDERWRRGVELVVASRGTAGGFLAAMGGTWVPVDSLVARARSPLERIFKRPIGLGNLEKHYDLFAFRRVH